MVCELFFPGSVTNLVITITGLIFRFFETRNDLKDIQTIKIEIN